jgi:hypothetical protein
MLEINRLIAEVKEKDDVRILPGDPAFAIVTLNQLTLEDLARRLNEGVRAGIAEFTDTVQKTEARAGKMLAQQVRQASVAVRQELQQDVETARLNATEMISRLEKSHRSAELIRWILALVLTAIVAFGLGLWAGACTVR